MHMLYKPAFTCLPLQSSKVVAAVAPKGKKAKKPVKPVEPEPEEESSEESSEEEVPVNDLSHDLVLLYHLKACHHQLYYSNK